MAVIESPLMEIIFCSGKIKVSTKVSFQLIERETGGVEYEI